MKLGLGLYRHMLTPQNFRFARQAGATHIVAHLVNYFQDETRPTVSETEQGFGVSAEEEQLWTVEQLEELRAAVNAEGLELVAIENFAPSHWHDVLLDGPRKQEQMENLKGIIRNMGQAGIPIMGYYFSLAGVWGRVEGPFARGGAETVGFFANEARREEPIPRGQVWNMVYDVDAPAGHIGSVSREEMWQRLSDFLEEMVPVAEEAGVRLAAHPDDPPMPELRQTARLIHKPELYQRLLDIVPSRANALEFCVGTVAEMAGGEMDVYEAVDQYSKRGDIAYIHLRNVRGKVPNYHEVFIDEGDVDMFRVLRILYDNQFDGVLIPDHTPQMECAASWHAGMAYALGWMKAALTAVEKG